MNGTEYLNNVLNRYYTTPNLLSYQYIVPIITTWGSTYVNKIEVSGSNAKGTAIKGVADLDLFVSLHSRTLDQFTLAQIYNSLAKNLNDIGHTVRRQNVSLRITHNGVEIDIVPAVKFSGHTNDHWLHVTKSGRDRTKTNIDEHIRRIGSSGRIDEIRLTKIWRKIHNLDFPSIYLEETVLKCLSGYQIGNLENNFFRVLQYLSTDFYSSRIVDPANFSNIISNDLTDSEKNKIRTAASSSITQKLWENIVR